MKMLIPSKKIMAVAFGTLFTLGMAANAMALPQFQVDPNMDGAHADSFYATSISGSSSEQLTISGTTLTATFGYLTFSGFTNDGPLGFTGPVSAADSGLGATGGYQLYLTFNLVAQLTSGTIGTPGSDYTLTSLNFDVWRDNHVLNSDALKTQFTAATTSANASLTANGDDIKLGSGSLISGVASLTTGTPGTTMGASLNSVTSYLNTAAGNQYFFDPSPFYNISFNAFNNTGSGVSANGDKIAINSAAGVVDFNRVPEPETLALMGVGLLGLGLSLRKRKAA